MCDNTNKVFIQFLLENSYKSEDILLVHINDIFSYKLADEIFSKLTFNITKSLYLKCHSVNIEDLLRVVSKYSCKINDDLFIEILENPIWFNIIGCRSIVTLIGNPKDEDNFCSYINKAGPGDVIYYYNKHKPDITNKIILTMSGKKYLNAFLSGYPSITINDAENFRRFGLKPTLHPIYEPWPLEIQFYRSLVDIDSVVCFSDLNYFESYIKRLDLSVNIVTFDTILKKANFKPRYETFMIASNYPVAYKLLVNYTNVAYSNFIFNNIKDCDVILDLALKCTDEDPTIVFTKLVSYGKLFLLKKYLSMNPRVRITLIMFSKTTSKTIIDFLASMVRVLDHVTFDIINEYKSLDKIKSATLFISQKKYEKRIDQVPSTISVCIND